MPRLHVVEYRCLSARGRWLAWAPIAGRGYYNRRDALRARDRLAARVGVSEYRVAIYVRRS